jgi:hypothetical protein
MTGKGCGRKWSWSTRRQSCSLIGLEGLKKTTEWLLCPGRDRTLPNTRHKPYHLSQHCCHYVLLTLYSRWRLDLQYVLCPVPLIPFGIFRNTRQRSVYSRTYLKRKRCILCVTENAPEMSVRKTLEAPTSAKQVDSPRWCRRCLCQCAVVIFFCIFWYMRPEIKVKMLVFLMSWIDKGRLSDFYE